jgi:hypothetical protein
MKRVAILVGSFLALMVLVVIGLKLFVFSYTKIDVSNRSLASVSLYPNVISDTGPYEYDSTKLVATIEAGKIQQVRLKKNSSYVAVINDTSLYAFRFVSINTSGTTSVVIDPNLSNNQLDKLAQQEKPAIIDALNGSFNDWEANYTLGSLKLYQKGDWAAVILNAKNSSKYDNLRTILRKNNQTWIVVVTPAKILITKPAYPSIPAEIIDDVDNFSQ